MLDPAVASFVLASLPPSPARVLEVGAGEGELAAALIAAGHDLLAIDPASRTENVRPIRLHELDEPPESFDAAVAVVSLHHVEPLGESCRRLAEAVRRGGVLVLEEFDVARLDERAGSWWLAHRDPAHEGHEPGTAAEIVAAMRHHCHDLVQMQDALVEWFELGPPVRGPYLYRWARRLNLREDEERLIAVGQLPEVGVRLVGRRRPDRE